MIVQFNRTNYYFNLSGKTFWDVRYDLRDDAITVFAHGETRSLPLFSRPSAKIMAASKMVTISKVANAQS